MKPESLLTSILLLSLLLAVSGCIGGSARNVLIVDVSDQNYSDVNFNNITGLDANFLNVGVTGFYFGDGSHLTGISGGVDWADLNANLVPYVGADANTNLGDYNLTAGSFDTEGQYCSADATMEGLTTSGGWGGLDMYPNTGDNVFHLRLFPSGAQDQSVITLFSTLDIANSERLRFQIDNATATILTQKAGTGTEPTLYFDSSNPFYFSEDVLPDTTQVYDLGTATYKWRDGRFSGDVYADGDLIAGDDIHGDDVVLGSSSERLVYPSLSVSNNGTTSVTVNVQFKDYGGTNISKVIGFDWWYSSGSYSALNPSATFGPVALAGTGTTILNQGNTTYNDWAFKGMTNSSGLLTVSCTAGADMTVYFHVINPTDGKVYVQSFNIVAVPP